MKKWLALGCVLASVAAVACGGETEDSKGGTVVSEGPVQEDQLAQKYADAVCDNAGACCQKYGFSYDASKCSTGLRAELEKDLSQIGQVDGLTYDPAKAGECVAWIKKLVSECVVSEAEVESMQLTCGAVWKGSKAIGEACTADVQCAGAATGTAECDQNPSSGTDGPKCVARSEPTEAPRGKKGDSCSGTCKQYASYTECAGSANAGGSGPTPGPARCWIDDGLQCDWETSTCVDLVPQGQPCSYTDICVVSASCNNGVCAPRTPIGGSCTPQFMNSSCVDGAYCDGQSNTCQSTAADGAACASDEQCASMRCENQKCIPANVMAEDDICIGQ